MYLPLEKKIYLARFHFLVIVSTVINHIDGYLFFSVGKV